MADEPEKELWTDILSRKHECYPYPSRPIPVDLPGGANAVTVWVPDNLNDPGRLEIRTVVGSGDLIVLLGRHTLADEKQPYERGVLMVARRADPATYHVHVWHEMYPYALKYLGIDLPTDGPGD